MTRSRSSPRRSGVSSEYDAGAAAYDRRWAWYNRRSLALLRPALLARPAGRVLDVGCGTAGLAVALEAWGAEVDRYVGVDLSAGMLREAGRKLRAVAAFPSAAVAGAADALPFRDAAFDTVVTASSLHYWRNVPGALQEAWRVLRPSGRLRVVDWCREYGSIRWMERWLRLTGRAVERTYTRGELAALLAAAGFQVERAERARISPVWGLMVVEAVVA
jgi:ubiquinone/menaquinone biosynthesis C-methylase UbiE